MSCSEQVGLVSPFQGVPRHGSARDTSDAAMASRMSGSPAMPMIGACFSRGGQAVRGTATGRDPRFPSGNLRARTVCRKDPDYPREGRVRLPRIQHLVGVGKSGDLVPKVRVGRKAITNIQLTLGRSPSLSPNCRKASRSALDVLRQSFVAGRTTSRSPTTSRKLPWAGPQGFLDRGESDMPEGRHIDCPMPPQVPLRRTPLGFTKTVRLARFQDTAIVRTTARRPEPYQPGCNQPLPGRRRMGGGLRLP